VRAKGQSLGSFSHWFANALISGLLPLMAEKSGGVPFVFFAVMMVVQFVVVLVVYPESKGVSLEQMQRNLAIS
jgi:sugar transport protein